MSNIDLDAKTIRHLDLTERVSREQIVVMTKFEFDRTIGQIANAIRDPEEMKFSKY